MTRAKRNAALLTFCTLGSLGMHYVSPLWPHLITSTLAIMATLWACAGYVKD